MSVCPHYLKSFPISHRSCPEAFVQSFLVRDLKFDTQDSCTQFFSFFEFHPFNPKNVENAQPKGLKNNKTGHSLLNAVSKIYVPNIAPLSNSLGVIFRDFHKYTQITFKSLLKIVLYPKNRGKQLI